MTISAAQVAVRKVDQMKVASQEWDERLTEYSMKKARLDRLNKAVDALAGRIKAQIDAAGPIDTLRWLAVISETPVKEHVVAAHVRRSLRVERKT